MSRWVDIATINNITHPYVIEIGQVLQLPVTINEDVRTIQHGTTVTAIPPQYVPQPKNYSMLIGAGLLVAGVVALAKQKKWI